MSSTEQQQSSEVRTLQDGDTFDEDSGVFLGELEVEKELDNMSIPVQLSVKIGSYYYIYKLDRKERIEE